ncbi:hypothetical protein CRYUN_Cryun33cG0026300 [Craigia yunnanensis]
MSSPQDPKTPHKSIEFHNPSTSTPCAGSHRFLPSTDSQPSPISTQIPTLPIESQGLNPNLQNPSPTLTPQSSWTPPSRISSLKTAQSTSQPLLAAAIFSGSLHILASDLINGAVIESQAMVSEMGFHSGPVAAVDLRESGMGYTAVQWASPSEFVTGGYGFGLQWWDQRRPGGPVSQFKGSCPWCKLRRLIKNILQYGVKETSRIVHSIDIHPSRKHTSGGSSGTLFAWDLKAQQQPIVLSGAGKGEAAMPLLSESEVWEVQYDHYTRSSNMSNISSTRILPVMICSEDGILTVIEQGEEPIELLAEHCAINSFDIDQQNPSLVCNTVQDVICSLGWESIAILTMS